MKFRPSHLDDPQGAGEQRTEEYKKNTSKEQSQPATQGNAKSGSRAAGSASRQAATVRRSRVVIDGRESGTSTGRYIDKLVENLHKLRPEIEFVILTRPSRVAYLKAVAPSFIIRESKYKEFGFGEQLGFARQLYKLKPDLVHFGMTQQPIIYRQPVVTTIHDLTTVRFRNPAKNPVIFSIKQFIYQKVIKIVARKSVRIITPSEYVKHDVAQYTKVSPRKIEVTHLAADKITDTPVPRENLEAGKFIMYVGRALPHKNLDRLVEAFALLKGTHGTHPDLKLVLAGKEDLLYERLQKKVKADGIKDVIFTSHVNEGELRWLYENTAAYVFPSLSEGFGLPGLEAMVHGAPVVSSNATCLPEIYGSAAHYFNPIDADDMAAKITDVITDESLRHKLIDSGRAQASKYSWRGMAEQTISVYHEALSS